MTNNPTVCAVMLTEDRIDMARRAVQCLKQQTYQRVALAVLDTGIIQCAEEVYDHAAEYRRSHEFVVAPIGDLRNTVNELAANSDIIIHWDDDDWSHPNRIAEQVALLQSSGADCVGYNEMLFWRDHGKWDGTIEGLPPFRDCETWLYSNPNPLYCLGTSLCYWRKAWEARPFEPTSQGEDARFIAGLRCVGVSSVIVPGDGQKVALSSKEPRMIASIHAGNTSNAYKSLVNKSEWQRVPAWDSFCRSTMTL